MEFLQGPFSNTPGLGSPQKHVYRTSGVDPIFHPFVDVSTHEEIFQHPIWAVAFFILASISSSSLRSDVKYDPIYLKDEEKWMLLSLLLSLRSGGSSFCSLPSFIDGGKYIASIFDLLFGDPTCI